MSSKQMGLRILAVFVLTAILVGCANTTATVAPVVPTAVSTLAQLPTSDLQSTLDLVKTQAAGTVIAGLTQNAPSDTPVLPTGTPTATATTAPTSTPLPPTAYPTATYIPWTLTPIYTATSAAYNCTITSVSPKATDTIKTGADFDGNWVAKNTGTQPWLKSDVDLKYITGTKFQTKGDLFDFKSDVAVNDSYTAIVDMVAPADAGTYYATWAFVRSGVTICTLNLTVVVIK
jgi:hypothetical protein